MKIEHQDGKVAGFARVLPRPSYSKFQRTPGLLAPHQGEKHYGLGWGNGCSIGLGGLRPTSS